MVAKVYQNIPDFISYIILQLHNGTDKNDDHKMLLKNAPCCNPSLWKLKTEDIHSVIWKPANKIILLLPVICIFSLFRFI